MQMGWQVYRVYATLYFIFVVDGSESELGILDLVHVFVESLDHVRNLTTRTRMHSRVVGSRFDRSRIRV